MQIDRSMQDQEAFAIAVEEAKISYNEGGVPIGAALVSKDGKLMGRGHNQRVQLGSPIHHVCCIPLVSMAVDLMHYRAKHHAYITQADFQHRHIKARLCIQP